MSDEQGHNPSWKITILVVDDHALMRGGLRKLLELESDIVVVAEASTGEQALELVRQIQPDVALIDINLPNLNGLQVTARLHAERHRTAIVLLTAYDDQDQIVHAMRAGASAYCPKDIQPEKLFEIIRQAARGNYVIGDKFYNERGVQDWLNRQIEPGLNALNEAERYIPLSPREMDILRCVTRGMHNKAIALELGISHQTVRNHITSILTKLNVRGRTQAAVYALKRGWVRAEEYQPPADSDD